MLKVVHTFGRNAGAIQTLSKPIVRFGRAPDNDIVFDANFDRDASGHHAELRLESGRWILVDLKSRNGTFVRGQRVSEPHSVAPGDELTFGMKGPRVRVEFAETKADPFGETARSLPAGSALAAAANRRPIAPARGSSGTERLDGNNFAAPAPAPAPAPPPPADPAPTAKAAAPMPIAAAAPARPFAAPIANAQPAQQPQPPRAPVPQAPPAGARVGQRTMAEMINNAVAVATGRARPKKTVEINAMVDHHVSVATASQRRTARLLLALLVVALVAVGGLIVWGAQSRDEIAHLREELSKLPPDDPRRKQIEDRLGQLHPSNANLGRNLYDQSRKGIFMLAGPDPFCTAFAVRPNVLATNAHCVVAAKGKLRVVALENEGHGQVSYSVSDMRIHPGYKPNDTSSISPDVGLVTISGRAAVVLSLASAQELTQTGAGDEVFLIGFPGRLMDASNPAATFLDAHIGRITNAQGRPGAFKDAWLVQHDAPTTHGTSGSPIFNTGGKVIAINAGGYVEEDDETIAGRKSEVLKDSPYKFGMRVDLLDAILR